MCWATARCSNPLSPCRWTSCLEFPWAPSALALEITATTSEATQSLTTEDLLIVPSLPLSADRVPPGEYNASIVKETADHRQTVVLANAVKTTPPDQTLRDSHLLK